MASKNVFITGIRTGLGYGLAQECLAMGWEVYGISRGNPASLMGNNRLHFKSVDLGDLQKIEARLSALWKGVVSWDLVILNAGVLGEVKDMPEQSLEELKTVMDVNLWSNKVILDALCGAKVEMKQVVTISSGAAVTGHRGWGSYALSKAALNMLTQLYAAELLQTHFSALAPGLIDTAMQTYLCESVDEQKFPVIQRLKSARHTSNMPTPEEAAKMIVQAIPRLLKYDSGSFVDIREFDS